MLPFPIYPPALTFRSMACRFQDFMIGPQQQPLPPRKVRDSAPTVGIGSTLILLVVRVVIPSSERP